MCGDLFNLSLEELTLRTALQDCDAEVRFSVQIFPDTGGKFYIDR